MNPIIKVTLNGQSAFACDFLSGFTPHLVTNTFYSVFFRTPTSQHVSPPPMSHSTSNLATFSSSRFSSSSPLLLYSHPLLDSPSLSYLPFLPSPILSPSCLSSPLSFGLPSALLTSPSPVFSSLLPSPVPSSQTPPILARIGGVFLLQATPLLLCSPHLCSSTLSSPSLSSLFFFSSLLSSPLPFPPPVSSSVFSPSAYLSLTFFFVATRVMTASTAATSSSLWP